MKRIISIVLIIIIALSFSSCENGNEGKTENKTETAVSGGNAEMTIGNTDTDGHSLYVSAGTFSEKAEVVLESVSEDGIFDEKEKYELLCEPMELSCEEYDGTFFATDVTLTVKLPASCSDEDEELERYVIVFRDETSGETGYAEPDFIDTDKGTMTVTLPHFSLWAAAKLTPEEEVARFLDAYSSKLAVSQLGYTKAAEEIGPYVQAKIDALGMTEEASEELKSALIKDLGGLVFGDAGELGAAAYTSLEKDDISVFDDEINSKVTDKLNEMLGSLGAKKAAALFKSADKTGKIAGYLAGGDAESALKEAASLMEDAIPFGSTLTKATGYIGAKVNECFTNWKANEVEELYKIYKNGLEDVWGNEVEAGNFDSMSIYLNTSSGFTKAKAINRFYNMDKVGEICKKYGWPYSTYKELPEKYKAEFNKRAEEGLRNYFEERLAQENAAAKIRAEEEICIKDMLEIGGALRSGMYTEFFGEKTRGEYSLSNRLNRLVNVRNYISQFVDEKALAESAKAGGHNYGSLINKWVSLYNDSLDDRASVIRDFTAFLKECGLLSHAYTPAPEIKGIESFMGKWYRVGESNGKPYTFEIVLTKSGDKVIEAETNLPWYDDTSCTEYNAVLEDGTLKLTGISSWIGEADAKGKDRYLELDASSISMTFTAAEVKDGTVTVMTNGSYTYER